MKLTPGRILPAIWRWPVTRILHSYFQIPPKRASAITPETGLTISRRLASPAKLAQLLLERFRHFNGAADKGWTIIPCELIDYNGEALKALVLPTPKSGDCPRLFTTGLKRPIRFVQRWLTASLPATRMMKQKSWRRSWATMMLSSIPPNISGCLLSRGPRALAEKLRLDRCPLNIHIVEDTRPYKERKVAILNGAHTALVPVAWLCGVDTVGEAMRRSHSPLCAADHRRGDYPGAGFARR